MQEHIKNLKELKVLTCLDCKAKKQGWACCVSKMDEFRLCDYIQSLNFAIDMLQTLQDEIDKYKNKEIH